MNVTNGHVLCAVWWDPDQAGPLAPRLVIGGGFDIAGAAAARNIAAWIPESGTWSPIGDTGADLDVKALLVMPDGSLLAGGNFTNIDGVAGTRSLARWNGEAWSAITPALGSVDVNAMMLLSNGVLVVGRGSSGASSGGVSRLDPFLGWISMGGGNGAVLSLARNQSDQVFAGGSFTSMAGTSANRVAKWSAGVWSALGSGMDGTVASLSMLPNGHLIAGGAFGTAGGFPMGCIARWNGSFWSPLSSGMQDSVFDPRVLGTAVAGNGDVVACGVFSTAGGTPAHNIARWNGTSWLPLGEGVDGTARTVISDDVNGVVVGGYFLSAGHNGGRALAVWNGSQWSGPGGGTNAGIRAFLNDPDGSVIAGGDFSLIEGTSARGVAQWNGVGWSRLGGGLDGEYVGVYDLCSLPSGSVAVAGQFSLAGGGVVSNIARWDGSSWNSLGAGLNGLVYAVAVLPSGELVAGGDFTASGTASVNHIAYWNGASWLPFGSGINGPVYDLAVLPNGRLVAGGFFNAAGGLPANFVAVWDDSGWQSLDDGTDGPVHCLAVLANGDLIVGGSLSTAGGIRVSRVARWSGSQWSAIPGVQVTDQVTALHPYQSGFLMGGNRIEFDGTTLSTTIARWDGAAWSPFGDASSPRYDRAVLAIADHRGGEEVLAGGYFSFVDGAASACFARHVNTPRPWIAVQPAPASVLAGSSAEFAAHPADGYARRPGGLEFRWLRNGVPIGNGPAGASEGGGEVSGAFGVLMGDGPAVLRIVGVRPGDGGQYGCEFLNECGSAVSTSAALSVAGGCLADVNEDGVIDFPDYLEFLNLYDAVDPRADLNGDGVVDFPDYLEFLNHFEAGC